MHKKTLTCQQADHDVPGLVCGFPLPCPYHTAIIDTEPDPPTVEVPVTATAAKRHIRKLSDIGKAVNHD